MFHLASCEIGTVASPSMAARDLLRHTYGRDLRARALMRISA
jgi:hypothetical protein